MNPVLDQQSCSLCRACYRSDGPACKDACRRCSIAMFSENEVNIYPGSNPYPMAGAYGYGGYLPAHTPYRKSEGERIYYNYPRVSNMYYPSMYPFVNYFGSMWNAANWF